MKQLQREKIWCTWKREWVDNEWKKIPHRPLHGRSSPSDPSTWVSFKVASQHAGDYDGRGYFFPSGLAGVDIDGDHTEGGATNPLAEAVRELFKGTYQETSPSGTGVHIVFRVDLSRLPGNYRDLYYLKNDPKGLECYIGGTTNRYFTYTGNRISDGEEVTDQTDTLLVFLEKYMRRDDPTNQKPPKMNQSNTTRKGPSAEDDF